VKRDAKPQHLERKTTNEKELYQQKEQAQLDEWQAEVDKLKAKASGASADAQLELNKQIKALKGKIENGKGKLAGIAEASDDAWESMKHGVESAWDSIEVVWCWSLYRRFKEARAATLTELAGDTLLGIGFQPLFSSWMCVWWMNAAD
jgi:LAS superfamily LD-carboxypeptidase LdcB